MKTVSTFQPAQRAQQRTRWAFATLSSALLLGCSSLGYSATLADVKLVDRNTGQRLTVYQHQGEYWVAGRPGASYSVDISNRTGKRILAVISVDGVNALNGQTASATPDDGYVLNPWQSWAITGWRKSDSQVAAFYFSESDASYASRTGRPRDVGVIGVALFREQPPVPQPAPTITPEPYSQRRDNSLGLGRLREEPASPAAAGAAGAPAAPAPSAEAESSARSPSADSVAKAAPMPSAKLGTAHGQRETSVVTHTNFTRLQEQPNEIISIRYDSRENLIASGVIRERAPHAFPQSGGFAYVPDPR